MVNVNELIKTCREYINGKYPDYEFVIDDASIKLKNGFLEHIWVHNKTMTYRIEMNSVYYGTTLAYKFTLHKWTDKLGWSKIEDE